MGVSALTDGLLGIEHVVLVGLDVGRTCASMVQTRAASWLAKLCSHHGCVALVQHDVSTTVMVSGATFSEATGVVVR